MQPNGLHRFWALNLKQPTSLFVFARTRYDLAAESALIKLLIKPLIKLRQGCKSITYY